MYIPALDGSFDINKGLRLARNVLSAVNNLGLPAGCEFLDMTTPQYFADLVAWGAIGARTGVAPALTLAPGGLGGAISSDNITVTHLLNIKRLAYELIPPPGLARTPAPDVTGQAASESVLLPDNVVLEEIVRRVLARLNTER